MNKVTKKLFSHDIFVDTGAWFAIMNKKSRYHQKLTSIYKKLLEQNNNLITSNFVIGETFTLMRYKLHEKSNIPFKFLNHIKKTQRIRKVLINDKIEEKAIRILNKYRDRKFSYVDATSFAQMREMEIQYSLTVDKHFNTAGFVVIS